jgi:hypothetical protein
MLKKILFYCICVIGLNGCNNHERINWASYSITIVDTNIVLDLPNIVKLKTGIEPECQGDPEKILFEFISIIKNDTIRMEVNASVEKNYSVEFKNRTDSTFFKRMEDKLVAMFPRAQIIERTNRNIGDEIIGIIKYSFDSKTYYKILYKFHSRHFELNIDGLKDENIMSDIIESIRFESSIEYMCW